jgi:hypothetical protein
VQEHAKDREVLLQYIQMATEATTRSRTVLLVLLVACVAAFFATWNIRDEGWLKSRLRVEEDVLRWWGELGRGETPLYPNRLQQERFEQASKFYSRPIREGGVPDSARIRQEVQLMREIRTEDLLTLRIPFFGVVFDVNDLTLFAGIAFRAILLWLRSALRSELRDLRTVFAKGRECGDLRLCYDLMAMRQVLTSPPSTTLPRMRSSWWLPLLLIALPFLLQTWLVSHHFVSLEAGESVNVIEAKWLLIAGAALLAFICLVALSCVGYARSAHREWRKCARELPELRPDHPQTGVAARQGRTGAAGVLLTLLFTMLFLGRRSR